VWIDFIVSLVNFYFLNLLINLFFIVLGLLIVFLVQDTYGYMVAFAGRKYAARSPPAFVANGTYTVTSFTLVRRGFSFESSVFDICAHNHDPY